MFSNQDSIKVMDLVELIKVAAEIAKEQVIGYWIKAHWNKKAQKKWHNLIIHLQRKMEEVLKIKENYIVLLIKGNRQRMVNMQ